MICCFCIFVGSLLLRLIMIIMAMMMTCECFSLTELVCLVEHIQAKLQHYREVYVCKTVCVFKLLLFFDCISMCQYFSKSSFCRCSKPFKSRHIMRFKRCASVAVPLGCTSTPSRDSQRDLT